MTSILESLATSLAQGDIWSKLGNLAGGDADEARQAVDTAGPALIGGLAQRAEAPGGDVAVSSLLDDTDPSLLDNIGGFLDRDDPGLGSSVLDRIFGDDRDGLVGALASHSGLGSGVFSKLLPMLAPIVTSVLAKRRIDDDLDADGVAALLSSEQADLEKTGQLGDWLPGVAAGAAGTGAAVAASRLGDTGTEPSDGPQQTRSTTTRSAAVAAAAEERDRERDRGAGGGLGWLLWAVAAAALVLALALLLSRCGDDESSDTATVAAEDADDGEGDDADSAESTTTTEEATTTTETIEATVAPDPDGDDDGEADADGDEAADADLQAQLEAGLADLELTDLVTPSVEAGAVTLTGTVDSDDVATAAEAMAAALVDDPSLIDNQIEVELADGGDTINAELDLAPVTFEYLSAQVSSDGAAVLDEVVAYLEANDGAVEIRGHTDSDGSEAANLTLSQDRADSVKAYLVNAGIDESRLTAVGVGEAEPLVPNDTPENKAANRRIEFVLGA